MSFFRFYPLLLAVGLTALPSMPAVAAPLAKGMLGPQGQLQQGSINHVAMSRSGRFVLIPDVLNAFGNDQPSLYVRDMQSLQTSIIASDGGSSRFYAISANGRYVAYWSTGRGKMVMHDRLYGTHQPLNGPGQENVGLSDQGHVLYNKQQSTGTQLVRYRPESGTEQVIASSRADMGDSSRRNPLSADGQVALFGLNGQLQLYRQQQTTPFQPAWNGTALNVGTLDLASGGRHVGFASPSIAGHYLYRANLQASGYNLQRFDMTPQKVTVTTDSGLSISGDGRFISFHGTLQPGHAEYAAAQAVGSPGYSRIFRYDTRLNQLATVSLANNGAQIRGPSGGTPLVNSVSMISDDGSIVLWATNAQNILGTPVTNGGEQVYHSYMGALFNSNYQFASALHDLHSFRPYSPMTLIGHHLWEAFVTTDPLHSSGLRVRLEAGGSKVNGLLYDATTSHLGSSLVVGHPKVGTLVPNGSAIHIDEGQGTYRITFNDQTLKYTINKPDWKRTVIFIQGQTAPGQDLFIRGGIDHGYAQNQLGRSCTSSDFLCAIAIRYRNVLNPYTANWKVGDNHLDWYGIESSQTLGNSAGLAQGTVLDWTTNNPANANKVATQGLGYTPLNSWGDHYWMLDADVDCSQTVNGWFEVKSFISNGPGWEPNVTQVGAPYSSGNHFAQCGKLNRFQRGNGSALILPLP